MLKKAAHLVSENINLNHSFSAIILCNFEKNKCGWSIKTSDELNVWTFQRMTTNGLETDSLPHPSGDYNGNNNGHYMIASNAFGVDAKPNSVAQLISPVFKSSEHPVECFAFYFNFGVSPF